jgi:hypothetical protein
MRRARSESPHSNLDTLPILRHCELDGGNYISSGGVITQTSVRPERRLPSLCNSHPPDGGANRALAPLDLSA